MFLSDAPRRMPYSTWNSFHVHTYPFVITALSLSVACDTGITIVISWQLLEGRRNSHFHLRYVDGTTSELRYSSHSFSEQMLWYTASSLILSILVQLHRMLSKYPLASISNRFTSVKVVCNRGAYHRMSRSVLFLRFHTWWHFQFIVMPHTLVFISFVSIQSKRKSRTALSSRYTLSAKHSWLFTVYANSLLATLAFSLLIISDCSWYISFRLNARNDLRSKNNVIIAPNSRQPSSLHVRTVGIEQQPARNLPIAITKETIVSHDGSSEIQFNDDYKTSTGVALWRSGGSLHVWVLWLIVLTQNLMSVLDCISSSHKWCVPQLQKPSYLSSVTC
jgi:hypothetical protein